MSEEERKDRLDIELRRAINTTTPEFDAEAWRQKYRGEFNTLLARAGATRKNREFRIVRLHPAFWLGVAAAIVVVGYGLTCWMGSYRTQPSPVASSVKSPAQIVTMSSLSAAFRRGGTEALDKQLDEAVRQLGPRPMNVPTARLLADLGS
jgi:hypothetical protein